MEQWKDINGYEWLYQISRIGEVKSFHNRKEHFLKKCYTFDWYLRVCLYKNWKGRSTCIHRIVWISFIENTFDRKEINHKNWIKTDNRIENLEWCTRSENIKHAYTTGLKKTTDKHISYTKNPSKWKFWKDNPNSKAVSQFNLNWELVKRWDSLRLASEWVWIASSSISMCLHWKHKTAWWFVWKFWFITE